MYFFPYLTPEAKEIINLIRKANYSVRENVEFCRNKDFFGFVDFGKKFVICTGNIKNSGFDPKFYINETVYHEAVHVAHHCNGYRPFGISKKDMPLPSNKLQDVKNSVSMSTASSQMEHEAFWMEDKPDKVRYVLKKYCF
jgi:hypothetical protein